MAYLIQTFNCLGMSNLERALLGHAQRRFVVDESQI